MIEISHVQSLQRLTSNTGRFEKTFPVGWTGGNRSSLRPGYVFSSPGATITSMATILQLVRRLECCPVVSRPDEWHLRHYADPSDVDVWLALREAAFADSPIAVRRWTHAEFRARTDGKVMVAARGDLVCRVESWCDPDGDRHRDACLARVDRARESRSFTGWACCPSIGAVASAGCWWRSSSGWFGSRAVAKWRSKPTPLGSTPWPSIAPWDIASRRANK